MAIRTSYKHNKDGSITKTTTYRRKTILGNTRSESFIERIEPKEKNKMNHRTKKIIKCAIIAYLVVAAILIVRQAMLA